MGPCRRLTISTSSLITLAVLLSQVESAEKVSCDNVTVANGAVFRTADSALSSSILVQCYPNYSLQPSEDSQLECIDGHVNLPLPQCIEKKNCSRSCDIEHGHCEPRGQQSFKSGDTIKLVCEDGYTLHTEKDTRTCRENGTWDDDQVQPACVLSGSPCEITESESIEAFLDPSNVGTLHHNAKTEVLCKKGYYTIGSVTMTCNNGTLVPDFKTQCRFKGVDVEISYSFTNAGRHFNEIDDGSVMNFEKDEQVNMTCKVSSKTEDGLPYPEVTWQYPARLRDYVEVQTGDTFVHTDYVNSVSQNSSIGVENKKHYAQGVLRISPTMEVHSGDYTCVVKLVSYTGRNTARIKIKSEFVIAMYFLLIIPVVLFVIVHCFYRKATLSPFPAPNKLTKDMMQEMMKELKREQALNNPPKKRDIVKDVLSAKSIIKSRSLETQGSVTKRSDQMIVLESTRKRSYNGMNPKKYLGKRPTMGLIDGSDLMHGMGSEDRKLRFVQDLRHRLANQIMKEAEEGSETFLPTSSRMLDSSVESEASYLLELEANQLFEADSIFEAIELKGDVSIDEDDLECQQVTSDRGILKASFLCRQQAISAQSEILQSDVVSGNDSHSINNSYSNRHSINNSYSNIHSINNSYSNRHSLDNKGVVEQGMSSTADLSSTEASMSSAPNSSLDKSCQILELEEPTVQVGRQSTDRQTDRQTDNDRQTDSQTLPIRQTDGGTDLSFETRPNKKDEIILTWLYSQNRSSSEESGGGQEEEAGGTTSEPGVPAHSSNGR